MLAEQRLSDRKVLKTRAMLALQGTQPMAARTFDINGTGVGITVSHQLPVGLMGNLSFEMFPEGKSTVITAEVRVAHCFFSNGEFKAGLSFKKLDSGALTIVTKYIRSIGG